MFPVFAYALRRSMISGWPTTSSKVWGRYFSTQMSCTGRGTVASLMKVSGGLVKMPFKRRVKRTNPSKRLGLRDRRIGVDVRGQSVHEHAHVLGPSQVRGHTHPGAASVH